MNKDAVTIFKVNPLYQIFKVVVVFMLILTSTVLAQGHSRNIRPAKRKNNAHRYPLVAPHQTYSGAIHKTASDGEIIAPDSSEYGKRKSADKI